MLETPLIDEWCKAANAAGNCFNAEVIDFIRAHVKKEVKAAGQSTPPASCRATRAAATATRNRSHSL
jgi:hypothetical protein